VHLQKVFEVMSTSVYIGLNPFNFIRKYFLQIYVRKVYVHLQKVFEVMSTSVYTGLNPFNFIRKYFLQICVRKVYVHLQKVFEVMSTSVYTGLNPFNFIRKYSLQICVRKVAVNLSKVVGRDVHERLYRPKTVPCRSPSAQRRFRTHGILCRHSSTSECSDEGSILFIQNQDCFIDFFGR
jgi:hypothetical protein